MTRPVARRWVVLLVALGLFGAVSVVRLAVGTTGDGLTFLYVLPVMLVAFEFGAGAGVAAAAAAVGLFGLWAWVDADNVRPLAYVTRGVGFLAVAVVTGRMASGLRVAAEEGEASARFLGLSREMLGSANLDGYFVQLNDSWTEALGWSEEELMARPFVEFVHPDDRARTEQEASRIGDGESTVSFTNRYLTKDGDWRWIEWSSRLDAERGLIYAAARDVTARRAAEEARREAEQRFRLLFEDFAIAKALVGVRGDDADKLIEANEALAQLCGYSRDELVGARTLAEFTHPDDRPAIGEGMRRLNAGEIGSFHCEFRLIVAGAAEIWVDLTTSLITDDDGVPLYRISQLQNVDARRRADEQLRHLADHDSLSGVYNRRRFEYEVEHELELCERKGGRGAMLMLDLDHFKAVNDTIGHAAGDEVIARFGSALVERLRSGDVAARLGGDEFAVMLRRVTGEEAQLVAASLVSTVKAALAETEGGGAVALSVSVGVAPFDGSVHSSYDDVARVADAAMYTAKAKGGDAAVLGVAHAPPVR